MSSNNNSSSASHSSGAGSTAGRNYTKKIPSPMSRAHSSMGTAIANLERAIIAIAPDTANEQKLKEARAIINANSAKFEHLKQLVNELIQACERQKFDQLIHQYNQYDQFVANQLLGYYNAARSSDPNANFNGRSMVLQIIRNNQNPQCAIELAMQIYKFFP